MTDIPTEIRALLACPKCGGALRDADGSDAGRGSVAAAGLACDRCALVYPVEEGIPVLLVERAQARTQA